MFFSNKEKVDLETYVKEFYETVFLDPVVANMHVKKQTYETILKQPVESDRKLSKIKLDKFIDEMTLIQFELFGLAWLHRFKIEKSILLSDFTKKYLHKNKLNSIWKHCEDYNQAIAHSTTYGKDQSKGADRMFLGIRNKELADMFDKYHDEGYDVKVIARAVNRMFAEDAIKKGITYAFITQVLVDRLGLKDDPPNEEAIMKLDFISRMFFERNKEKLNEIEISN